MIDNIILIINGAYSLLTYSWLTMVAPTLVCGVISSLIYAIKEA